MSDQLTEKIINAAIEVHSILGPGLLESIYEEALCYELSLRKILHEQQVPVDVHYKKRTLQGDGIKRISL